LDKLWNISANEQEKYPEVRMRKLIEVMSNDLVSRVQIEFKNEELWDLNQPNVKQKLNEAMKFLKQWKEMLNSFTTDLWKGGARKWTG
jgi:broad specificity polyphosphatase/5'/3'-nucleotidase SurE